MVWQCTAQYRSVQCSTDVPAPTAYRTGPYGRGRSSETLMVWLRSAQYRSGPYATDALASPCTVLAGTDRVRSRLPEGRVHPGGMAVLGLALFLAGHDVKLSSGKQLASASSPAVTRYSRSQIYSQYCSVLFSAVRSIAVLGSIPTNKGLLPPI